MTRSWPWLGLLLSACGSSGGVGAAPDAGAAAGGWAGTSSGGKTSAGGSAGSVGSGGSGNALAGGSGGAAGATATAGTPAHIEMVSGNGAALLEGWPGATLKVKLTDANGAPVPGVNVDWSVVSGDGVNVTSPGLATTPSDADGISARMIQGVFFAMNEPFGQGVVRASSPVGNVDFGAVTVHATSIGPIGPLLVLVEPTSLDLGDVKAGSVLAGAAKLQAVVQAGSFSGTALPNVGLRFVDGIDHDKAAAAGCVGGTVLSDATGIATCDLAIGSATGEHWISAYGGEATVFSAIRLNVVP